MLRSIAVILAGCVGLACAAPEVSSVDEIIPAAIKSLPEPVLDADRGKLRLAVSTADETAQKHVVEGLDHLHGGWDFEASRHFAAALKRDPDCMLACWGMAVANLPHLPETSPHRDAAVDRMLALVEEGKGGDLERGYAFALVQYVRKGPEKCAEAFHKVGEKYPNDLQAPVFEAIFTRTGFDEEGEAMPDQQRAEQILRDLVAKHPENPLPLNALLTIRAEAPDLTADLPLARKLVSLSPDYPPYFHLLGHYEYRCGNYARAASAFGRASSLYDAWRKSGQVTLADCGGWMKSECYRIVSLDAQGDFETAMAAAKALASAKIPKGREASSGARLLYWEGQTLPARLLMRRGQKGDAALALASLPKPADVSLTRAKSFAYWYIDGLRIACESKRLLDEGKITEAATAAAVLAAHGEKMEKTQDEARTRGERSLWLRGYRALETTASELKGQLALAGPASRRAVAYNWFRSAADRQVLAAEMMSPTVLLPMQVRLGELHMTEGHPDLAIESYQEALRKVPNDLRALSGLQAVYQKTGKTEDAAEIGKRIAALKVE